MTQFAFATVSGLLGRDQSHRAKLSRTRCSIRMCTSSTHNDIFPSHQQESANIHHLEPELDQSSAGDTWSGGGAGYSGRGSGGGSGGRDDAEPEDAALSNVLREQNTSAADLPSDIVQAYRKGYISAENVSNYLIASNNIISRAMMAMSAGLRNRFIADRLFLLKIAIEEGIGIFGKLTAEYEQRRENFWTQKEFVFANLITAILADFALVYLPAPSVRLKGPTGGGGLGAWFSNLAAGLPSNVFQTDRPFTLAQRGGGFALKAAQLFGVGFFCCFAGIVFTNTLVALRERFDTNYTPSTEKQNPLVVPLLYAVFLGVSSGSRYQLVNGIENHIFPRLFASTPKFAEEVATFVLRYGNTFWGSQQWVMFCRFTNAQKLKSE